MANWSDRRPSTSASVRRSSAFARRWCVGVTTLLIALSWLGSSAGQVQLLDRILAFVDGEVIMRSDVRAFIELDLVNSPVGSDTEPEVLTYLIERRLMLNEANRFGVAQPDAALVDRRYEAIQRRFGSTAELERVLARNGFSPGDLRQLAVDEIRREAYVADRFSAIDPALRDQARAEWVSSLVSRAQIRRAP